jgi:hypothetical protein
MSDELARWAARRAPDLLARAEAEAVAELRRALIAAATGAREPAPPPRPPRVPGRGDVLWAYGVTRAGAAVGPGEGVAGPVERLDHGELAMLVSRVPRAEFGEEPLRENLNDFAWLERVARAHEAVLEAALADTTVVPLRLCTIFDGEPSAAAMLDERAGELGDALAALDGREEWSVKLLADPDALRAAAATARDEAPEAGGSGAAYMLRRRTEREDRDAADQLAATIAEDAHARLAGVAEGAVVRPAQNRELSGHDGEMLLNGAYLVDAARVPELRALVAELGERHAALGVRLDLSGPFPAYNFVPGLGA